MNAPSRILIASLSASVSAPSVVASTCTTQVDDLCKAADDYQLDRVFGPWADLGLILVGLVAVAGLVSLFVGLARVTWRRRKSVIVETQDSMREIQPGGTAKLAFTVQNPNAAVPAFVRLDPTTTPPGWLLHLKATREMAAGNRLVLESDGTADLHLPPASAPGSQAAVEVQLIAPTNTPERETVEYEFRVAPAGRGGSSRKKGIVAPVTILVTGHSPLVQITQVQHEPEKIRSGAPVTTRARVANRGEREALDVAVQFLLNGQELDKKVVPVLAPSAETDVEFTWQAQPGENHIRVAVT